jgi:hypothetical protein
VCVGFIPDITQQWSILVNHYLWIYSKECFIVNDFYSKQARSRTIYVTRLKPALPIATNLLEGTKRCIDKKRENGSRVSSRVYVLVRFSLILQLVIACCIVIVAFIF